MRYYYISGNPPLPDKATIRRHTILCILKHRQDDSYGILHRTSLYRNGFVMGGVDDDTLEDAGKREISEETGYIDIRYEQTLADEIHVEYFAPHKDINRYGIEKCVVYHLMSAQQHDHKLDDDNHTFEWVPRAEVETHLEDTPGISSHLYFWYVYTGQEEKAKNYAQQFTQLPPHVAQ